jgi:hypothetical protein
MTNLRQMVISDGAGNTNFIGTFGEQVAGEKFDDISVQFQYDVLNTTFDLNSSETTTTGDGSNTATGSYAQASSATTGTATIQSRDSIRYRPGHTGFADFTAYFSGTGTGEAGCFDDEDGFKLKVVNDSASFGYIKGGVETGFVSEGSWNGVLSPDDVEWDKLNIFKITFGFLGVANATLWIRKNEWYPLVTLQTEGQLTGTHVNNPVFPITIKATNGMTVRTGSWNGGTIGALSRGNTRSFHFPTTTIVNGAAAEQGEMTLSGTNVGTIAIFQSKTTFQSKTNKVKGQLLSYDFHVDVPAGTVTGTVIFQIIVNPTLSGTASYTDINTNSSVYECDHTAGTGASVSASSGTPIVTGKVEYVGANKGGVTGNASIDADRLGLVGYRDDVFAVIAKDTGGNNVTVRISLSWEELF